MIAGHSTAPSDMSFHAHLNANDHSHVDQQIGAQFNDVVHNATFYSTPPDDMPDQMHVVARRFLDGGNPRRAEELLRTLHRKGHATNERCYLYVLSVLSDRSFTEITTALSDEIHAAMQSAVRTSGDEWWSALDVIDKLLRYAHAEFSEGAVEAELGSALETFGDLMPDRQDEIVTHLSSILSGAEQEWLNSQRENQVAVERMSGGRDRRAWKFFEADPRQPWRWVLASAPATPTDWRDAILGSGSALLALATLAFGGRVAGAATGVVLLVVAGFISIRCMRVWHTYGRHIHSLRAHHAPSVQPEMEFDGLVDQCFRDEGVHVARDDSTSGYRAYLKRRLQHQYGASGCHPGELKWLALWHVRRCCGGNSYLMGRSGEQLRATKLRPIGVVVWVVAVIVLAAIGQYWAALLAIGGWWGISGIARITSVSGAQRLLVQDADDLLAEEWVELQRWRGILADRPEDAEMERWLALDKTHLKNEALLRSNLRERDLVSYVVLTERAPFARGSRISGGPPRYEAYLVYVFLLTKYGMRTTRTTLRLTTGELRNDQHQMCTYDAVASASVTEKSLRSYRNDGRPSAGHRGDRIFRLVLLNGTCIAEVREPGRVSDASQPAWGIAPGEPDSTLSVGFDSALRVLEAVATEGKDWIARDRERKQRWARNWSATPLAD